MRLLQAWSRIVVVHACRVFWVSLSIVLLLAITGGCLVGFGGTQIDGVLQPDAQQHTHDTALLCSTLLLCVPAPTWVRD